MMKVSKLSMLIGGIGCWVIFAFGVATDSFGLLGYIFQSTFVANFLFYLSLVLAGVGVIALIIFLKQNKILSFAILGGILATGYLSALVVVWLYNSLRI